MYNNENNINVDIKPACIGTLQKSHQKAVFIRCHLKSNYFTNYIENNPRVLQIMAIGNEEIIAEVLPEDVYNTWIDSIEEK